MSTQLLIITITSGLLGSAHPPTSENKDLDTPNIGEVANTFTGDQTRLLNIIKFINRGNMIINDMCEMMEEKTGVFYGSDKPNCRYNASFISDNTITLFDIPESVRDFFLNRKKEGCKNSKQECGELTIILKLVDLINSVVHISLKMSSLEDLFLNIESVSFFELFEAYQSSLKDPEILANITLRKDRANLILDRERLRIKKFNSRTSSDDFFDGINYYIGAPIKASLCYVGDTIGSSIGNLLGSTIEQTTGGLGISGENKTILIGLVILYIFKR
jgi:hypothetical protein